MKVFRKLAWFHRFVFFLLVLCLFAALLHKADAFGLSSKGPVIIIDINGPITPAKDRYLTSSLKQAHEQKARLFVVRLNTPGGLLASTQSMVEALLESDVPTVVYVAPRGGGAISAGVFITLAGHFAYMAPGTNIGAAHPVASGGQDLKGDMREKLENYAVSLIRAIANERGRNVQWAEKAVRESVAITAREALDEGVIDGLAGDLDRLLEELEAKTINVKGSLVTLHGLRSAKQQVVGLGLRNTVIDILCDPNIAILLGFAAMICIAIELHAPGGFVAGTIGLICLVLSLIAAQTLPINHGGAILLVISVALFAVELFVPSFGFWGVAGIICLILGSIYFVDTDMVWSAAGFTVNMVMIGALAVFLGAILSILLFVMLSSNRRTLIKDKDKLMGDIAQVISVFSSVEGRNAAYGKVEAMGKVFPASFTVVDKKIPAPGSKVRIVDIDEQGKRLLCEPIEAD